MPVDALPPLPPLQPRSLDWVLLIVAGFCEVGFATCMRLSQNFSKWPYTLGFAAFLALSMYLLSVATQRIPLGTGYAVWTGIGAAGTAILGIVFFKEPATVARMVLLVLLIGSVAGLKWVG